MVRQQSKSLWLKNIENPEVNKNLGFRKEFYIVLENSSSHCYRHLVQTDRIYLERSMWAIIHLISAVCMILLTYSSYESFALNPLVTTLHDTVYPIKNIPFPAVSVCSNNRISRKAAEELAEKLNDNDPQRRGQEFFLKEILHIGQLYEFHRESNRIFTAFQQLIDETTGSMSFLDLIQKLTPKCEDLLIRCFFQSKEYKCIQKYQMMETRKNSRGFCCSFNYEIKNDDSSLNIPYYSDVIGPDMGLILVVNSTYEDYFYNIFNTIGFSIQIHNFNDFPDPASGTAIEEFIGSGKEIFIRVDATSITSSKDILGYTAEKRQCLFSNENPLYRDKYTRSECILNCKARSIRVLCGCVPFNLPSAYFKSNEAKMCSLEHTPCLNQYKIKWATILLESILIDGLEREMEESLLCRECYSSCSYSKYRVTTSTLPLVVNKRDGFGLTNGIKNVSDISVIRVFFGQRETWQYKQDVSSSWFEIFSNIGGLCGIVGGFSLISFTEFIYFFIKQIILLFMRMFNLKKRRAHLKIYP